MEEEDFNNNGESSNANHTNSEDCQRRQMLLNHVLLVEAHHQQGQTEAYEELKRLIIFAGIFFLFMIIFVLLKFQVSLDDVFKWSPVVWLVGVIICGLIMNIFLQLKKFVKRRRAKRLREQQNLLYSLNLPTSFPCLAPPPHNECCQCVALIQSNPAERNLLMSRRALSLSTSSLITLNPVVIPSYEQVMKGAKTWIITENGRGTTLPPTYSTANVSANAHPVSCPTQISFNEGPCSSRTRSTATNIPPPAYDESLDGSVSLDPSSTAHPPPFTSNTPNTTITTGISIRHSGSQTLL